ncbi:MAG: SMC-Scp complex subunit ScpB [Verrucomicrobiota bacterium]
MAEESADLKRIVGSMIFASAGPLKLSEIRKCLKQVEGEENESAGAEQGEDDNRPGPVGGSVKAVSEGELRKLVDQLQAEINELDMGFNLMEVAGGFRFETDPLCGKWLKQMLKQGGSQRFSQPALETLAIIAYRQPITRGEIERIRGVSVDHVVRNLLEFQMVKIVGRSELPGKPFLYGTTQKFLQHFGLKSIKELEEIQPMLKVGEDFSKKEPDQDADEGSEGSEAGQDEQEKGDGYEPGEETS